MAILQRRPRLLRALFALAFALCTGGQAAATTPTPTVPPTPGGDCCSAHAGPGCDPDGASSACQDCICAINPFCCAIAWDARCSRHAVEECAGSCACGGPLQTPTPTQTLSPAPTLGPPPPTATPVHGGSCCDPHVGVGCDEASCEDCVCATDPYCCALEWDARCSQRVATQCAASCTSCGSNDACADATVVTPGSFDFSTVAATTDGPPLPAECEEGSGLTLVNDIWYRYTPPCDGSSTFDLCNLANYDTRLAVYSGSCDNLTLVACNDDVSGCAGFTSSLTWPGACGTSYLIRLGGFSGSGSGSFNLSCDGGVCGPPATPTPVHGGTCCDPHSGVGCDEAVCEDCVCATDPYCCALEWDGRCSDAATSRCDAACTTCSGATPTPTPGSFTVGGSVVYYGTGAAVPGAIVEVRTDPANVQVDSTVTASDGSFAIAGIPRSDVFLRVLGPSTSTTAVSALDASYALQASAGRRSLSRVQRLAADVTGDGIVDAADAAGILQLRVGLVASLPAAARCGASWFFFPVPLAIEHQSVTLPSLGPAGCEEGRIAYRPLTRSDLHQDFVAVLLGDCTGNWQSPP